MIKNYYNVHNYPKNVYIVHTIKLSNILQSSLRCKDPGEVRSHGLIYNMPNYAYNFAYFKVSSESNTLSVIKNTNPTLPYPSQYGKKKIHCFINNNRKLILRFIHSFFNPFFVDVNVCEDIGIA